MVQTSPEMTMPRRARFFLKTTFAVCVLATMVSTIAVGQASVVLAASIALAFWLAYALLAIRITRKQLEVARHAIQERDEFPSAVDRETGLCTANQFNDLVKREIARSLRYGDRTAVAIFDIRIAGFEPTAEMPEPPSPADFIAKTLQKSVRETDIIGRLDMTHFGVLMTESDEIGAQALISRVRTWLALEPFVRDASGKGVYVRAWAGAVAWKPEYHDSATYVKAALEDMERSRPNYEAMQAAFIGNQQPLQRSA